MPDGQKVEVEYIEIIRNQPWDRTLGEGLRRVPKAPWRAFLDSMRTCNRFSRERKTARFREVPE